ncbi:MAG: MBL fold metallo-hydrolase [Pyrinomonadaceae bacterium]
MHIQKFVLTAFQQNTRVVSCEATKGAVCIDPGEPSDEVVEYIRSTGLQLQAITLTHGHLDHVGGTAYLANAFPEAEVLLHIGDEPLYYGLPQQPLFMGIKPEQMRALGMDYEAPPKLSRNWMHNEVYEVGQLNFSVRHCPGHTPGHVVLAEENEKKVFVGDCLFEGSIGRTDLPGGSYEQLIESINDNIISLSDDVVVYSGHGPETTVGRERMSNPFLTGQYMPGRGRFI